MSSFDPSYDYSSFLDVGVSDVTSSDTVSTDGSSIETTTTDAFTTTAETVEITTESMETTELIFDPQTTSYDFGTTTESKSDTVNTKASASSADITGDNVPIYWIGISIIITAVAALAIFLVLMYCIRKRKRAVDNKSQPEDGEDNKSHVTETTVSEVDEVKNKIREEREDSIRLAIQSGSIPILEFALFEASNVAKRNDLEIDNELVKEANKKMQSWKKTTKKLEDAVDTRDVHVMRKGMERFKKQAIKDDTRVYAQADQLLNSVDSAKSEMQKACVTENKDHLKNSILAFNALKLPVQFTSVDEDYLAATTQLEKFNEDYKIQSQQEVDARIALNLAVANKDESLINVNMGILYTAGFTDADEDIKKGKKMLEEIARDKMKAKAWKSYTKSTDGREVKTIKEKLDKCRSVNVEESKLLQAENFLSTVKKENNLIATISMQLNHENLEELKASVLIFRMPDSGFVDKTGTVKEAEEFIERKEIELRKQQEVEELKVEFKNSQIEGNVQKMEDVVERLERYGNLVDGDYLANCQLEIDKLHKQNEFRKQFENLKNDLSDALEQGDSEKTNALLIELDTLLTGDLSKVVDPHFLGGCKAMLDNFRALEKTRQENEAKQKERDLAEKRGEELKAEKHRNDIAMQMAILGEIDKLAFNAELNIIKEEMRLPQTEANIQRLEVAVQKMKSLCESGYVLSNDDQMLLIGCQNTVIRLKAEREQRRNNVMLEIDTIRSKLQLPRNPEHLDALQNAAKSMEDMREKSAEFPGIFTEEDEVLLKDCQVGVARIIVDIEEKRLQEEEMARKEAEELELKKASLRLELAEARKNLQIPDLPDNLESLQLAVKEMERLQVDCAAFPELFHLQDTELLEERKISTNQLAIDIQQTKAAEEKIKLAMQNRDFHDLSAAVELAENSRFFEDDNEIVEARGLLEFLNPEVRAKAIREAARSRDPESLRKAIEDFTAAKVPGHDALLEKAERSLYRQEKMNRRRARDERRQLKAEAHRKAVVAKVEHNLQEAINSKDLEELESALEAVEVNQVAHDELQNFAKAERLFDMIKFENLSRRFTKACQERDVRMLQEFVVEAEGGKYAKDLGERFQEAKKQIHHLKELKRLRETVISMNRGLIAEVGSYPAPPALVKRVMTATLVLLGDHPKLASDWTYVQNSLGKLGKESITRKVQMNAPQDIPPQVTHYVQSLVADVNAAEVKKVSLSAASFLAWIKCTLAEIDQIEKLKHI